MFLEHYAINTSERSTVFEFYSIGSKGKICKVVRFTPVGKSNIYALSLCDKDEITGELDDSVVTNNNDKDLVLATTALIVYEFTILSPDAWILAKGSTTARNRLYQIGISKHFEFINDNFLILGMIKSSWKTFQQGQNYSAFLIKRK